MINTFMLKLGGLLAARDVAGICQANHLPVLVGSMIKSGVRRLASAYLAVTQPGVSSAGLRGSLLFRSDTLMTPLMIREGVIWLDSDGPGLDSISAPAFVERHRVTVTDAEDIGSGSGMVRPSANPFNFCIKTSDQVSVDVSATVVKVCQAPRALCG